MTGNQEKVSCFFALKNEPIFQLCRKVLSKSFQKLCHICISLRSKEWEGEIYAVFLEQDSTTVPNFANRSFLSYGNLVGVATPSPPFAACAA